MTNIVSIGICAHNEARRISTLLDSLLTEELPSEFVIAEIIVVASGCTDGTDRIVEERAKSDPRLLLIRETERRGKSSALNEILSRHQGDILVLVNGDARLLPGSLRSLVQEFKGDDRIQLACGFPTPDASPSPIVDMIEAVWWRLHNRTLQALSDRGLGNHCCDELMAMRRGFADSIPRNLVNDGAYFGVLGAIQGITVRFCRDAIVIVESPSNLNGLLQQRRRIVRGHRQVAQLLGAHPFTLEGLVRSDPFLAARIVLSELSHRPIEAFAFLSLAGPLELLSHLLSIVDRSRRPEAPAAWPVVG